MKKIVLASSNPGKLHEFQQLFALLDIVCVPQSDYQVSSVEETGLSFIENAILKARHAAKITGLPALADDSGLVVDALEGRPGIYSARYAGEGASAKDRNQKLLDELKGVPSEKRQAHFCCALALMQHENDPSPLITQGLCHGTVLEAPRGHSGFGYDPVIYLPEQQCTMAELDGDEKNKISHRGKATAELLTLLRVEI